MSIAYNLTISPAGTLEDVVDRASNSQLIVLNHNTVQVFNILTGSQVGTNISTTSVANRSICLVNNASAIVWNNNTNADLIEIDTGFKQNYSGVLAVSNTQTGQQSAGDTTNKRAMAITNATAKVALFDGNTFTGSNFTISPINNNSGITTCITLKSADRWIVGSNIGMIVEIDHSNNVYHIIQLPQQPNANYVLNQAPVICGLSFDGNDFLTVTTTAGFVYVYAYATNTLLYTFPFGAKDGTTLTGSPLCAASSGTTILSYNYGMSTSNVASEFDFTTCPPRVRDVIFMDSSSNIFACGIQNTIGWVARANTKISTFTISSRNASTTSSVIQNPPGTAVQGRLIRIIDNEPNSYIDVDTIIGAQSTPLSTVTGQSVIEIAIINSGTDTMSDITRFSS